MLTQNSAIATNRFGLGARPRDAAAIGADPKGWLEDQITAAKRATPKQPGPPESAQVLEKLRDLQAVRQAAAQARANAGQPKKASTAPASGDGAAAPATGASPGIGEQAIREFAQFSREHYLSQVNDRNRRAIETDQPFIERLVQFWSNHFAISADKALVGPIAGLYEQEAIRPHVTGNFYDLLVAAERHPAMNMYLDNTTSMGPNSQAASFARSRGRTLGLNENLAREILELHTLGVDGGYTQRDVTEFAKVITGWSIGGAIGPGARGAVKGGNGRGGPGGAFASGGNPGEFYFRPAMHEPGDKIVVGRTYKEDGVGEGEQVLASLARSPATAKHLATKLARHFVADDPPAVLVARLADSYLKHDGELAPVYRELIRADESWREPLAKYKTPNDFVISTFRALDHVPDNLQQVTAFLNELGQRPFTPGSPAGWPDTAANWDGGDALLKRIEWSGAVGKRVGTVAGQRLDVADLAASILAPVSEATLAGIRGAGDDGQALALLISAPEFQRR
jgi:uncharacterized protein (DUF1800 family)